VRVIHRCAEYVGVEKPADMNIDGGRRGEKTHEPNVAGELGEAFPGATFRHCHQLDFATSGAMLYAASREAAREAARLFEARSTRKQYLALVRGHVDESELRCDLPICQDPDHDFKMMLGDRDEVFRGGKSHKKRRKHSGDATTLLRVLARGTYRAGDKVTKVLLTPTTGRRHQLRLHCVALGHPIVGDATYTDDDQSPRMMLHAFRLHLPFTHRPPLTLEAPDPFLAMPDLVLLVVDEEEDDRRSVVVVAR